MSVFLDSSVLVAAANRSDGNHASASALILGLADEATFISDHIMVEVVGLIRRWMGWAEARRWWLSLDDAPLLLEVVTSADLERARAIALAWPDQRFSIVDCTSFALMERVGCRRVASFDNDFAIYRYGIDRAKAFEVIR